MDGLFARADNRVASLSDKLVVAELVDVLETDDVTFVVGSGVSLFPPASVVNGQRVTEAIAAHLSDGLPKQDVLRRYLARAAFEVIFQHNDNDAAVRKWLLKLFTSDDPKKPNSIHRSIAVSLARKPAHVITTNYDRFIERALLDVGVSVDTIIKEDDTKSASTSIRYFKIHGCTSDPATLIFKLEQERPLQGWKARTFRSLVEGRIVIVIGYSGKDFEICPALLEAGAKAILWNAFSLNLDQGDFPSENAEHLFKHLPLMLFLKGDMHDIFLVKSQRPSNVDEEILGELLADMTPGGVARWRAAVLDVIGAPRQTRQVLRDGKHSFDPASRFERLTGVAYRRGKYRTAIYYGARLAAARSRGEGIHAFGLRAGLDAAFKLRNRGNHRLAKLAYGVAGWGWSQSTFRLRREYAMNMAWFEILDLLRFVRFERRLKRRVGQMESISLKQGFWGSYYLVRDVAEEIGLSPEPGTRTVVPAMPSQLGFKHIGNIPAQLDAFKNARLGAGISWQQIEEEIQLARDTELHPERWKCALAALEAGGWSAKQDVLLLRHVFAGLWKCEYTSSYEAHVLWRAIRAVAQRYTS
ncbi:SIR2 family protein [Bradyrhizobium stylosanthis]|uniref:SIR2 family protein n=1 Tax=Bradyrhizobium stylosanthis TaxID=1803665 RepID=UPI0007C5245F|nr:SIR2 family protein [Bradyrhizobium stylosanthis]